MKWFWILVCLMASLSVATEPPEPTEEINAWIRQLGSDEFAIRVKAQDNLEAAGHKAILGLERACDDEDVEIRFRARRALRNYFFVPEAPTIWYLPSSERYKDDEDVAKEYYTQASDWMAKIRPGYFVGRWAIFDWRDSVIGSWATSLYFYDRLRQNTITRHEMNQIIARMKVISEMEWMFLMFTWDYRSPPGKLD